MSTAAKDDSSSRSATHKAGPTHRTVRLDFMQTVRQAWRMTARDWRAGELTMLLLRLTRGLNFDDFAARTGFDARAIYSDQIGSLSRHGLLHVDQQGFRLTDQGLPLADAIASQFLNLPESS